MAKKKTGLTLSYNEWNPKKQYKVNESVLVEGVLYQNSTGKNSDPRLSLDWVVIDREIEVDSDSIIIRSGYTISPNNINFNSGYVWEISNVQYQLFSNKNFPITPITTTGNARIDIIVADQNNNFVKIEGLEGINVTSPNIPNNTLLVESLFVNDSGFIIEPTPEESYIERLEMRFVDYYMGGLGYVSIEKNSGYNLMSSTAPLKAILVPNNYLNYLWEGKEYKLQNKTNSNITIKHLDTTLSGFSYRKFSFPNSLDYVLKPNEIIKFIFFSNTFVFSGSNVGGVSGTNRKLLLMDLNEDGSIFTQGVTGNVILKSYTIPLNKVNKSGVFIINLRMSKPEGVEATFNSSVNFDTSINQFPFNSMNSQSANNKFVSGIRNVKSIYNATANTSLMSSFTSSGNYYTDYMPHANIVPSKVINYGVDGLRVFVIVNTTSLTDKIALDFLTIEFLEL